ncbi:hotdog domain-containing protein [Jeotgalibacillus marinus]|uniref:Hotdog domain-containing protein n=1 Tax=Jeotgalibacillus marinus TaxID=86667 RepID=A0ABV3Q5F8_9BACL
MTISVGDVFTWVRTFKEEETLQFAQITGDQGRHHMERDEQGRLMVHGLLTASIGTKIGGDMNYIARQMNSEFLRPVFTGDTVTCELIVTKVDKQQGFTNVAVKSTYKNQHDKEVMLATSYGVIRD